MSLEVANLIPHYRSQIFILDDGSFEQQTVGETGESIELASLFDKFLESSKSTRRAAIHLFFSVFISQSLHQLGYTLFWEFLNFDHGNDDEPTFDDKYSPSLKRLRIGLVDLLRKSVQHQTEELVGNATIEDLLEESGVYSRLHSSSIASLLATHLDESEVLFFRRLVRHDGNREALDRLEKYELSVAQYQTRLKGLTIRENQELVSRTREEICARIAALETPTTVNNVETTPSVQSGSPNVEADQKGHTYSHKSKGKTLDSGRIWKHLTISRDETSASDFLHERLLVLFLNNQYTCNNHDTASHSKIRNSEALSASGQEEQSVPFTTYPRTRAKFEPYSSQQAPHQQVSVARSPDTNLCSPSPFNNMDSRNHELSVEERDGDIRSRQPVSGIAPLKVDDQSTKNDSQSFHENWKIIHLLTENPGKPPFMAYIDKPVWGPGLKGDEFSLKAFLPLTDAEGYVRQSGFDFSINREYSNECLQPELRRLLSRKQPPPEPLHHREVIKLHSQEMIEAMEAFVTLQPRFWKYFPNFDAREPIEAPYMFWYTYRSAEALQQLSELHQNLMRTLTSWIDRNYEENYTEAKRQLEKGVVTLRTVPFLLFPGDVLVWKEKQKTKSAITSSLLVRDSPPILYWDSTHPWLGSDRPIAGTKKGEFSTTWKVQTWSYKFDGEFVHDKGVKQIKFKASSLDQEVPISKLGVHPLRFADEKTTHQLDTRGRSFWACRHRNFVSYIGEEGVFANGERFMVDFQIYRELHSDSLKFQLLYEREEMEDDYEEGRYKISAEDMASETPPSPPEIYVFPATVPGYNLRSKKWVDLEVDLISDVKWNAKSFDNLVIDPKAKELIQALVSHQIESEKGTDLIRRKGNGLIILLHGGPGTGKTFTAESVAEIAQKPLFCVTCGDIGTKPEQVEKYLESVLYLGKTWGCVVLIDEAEVFLEQRSLDNLERNALVSVFLRVLEYYEGILILTTNRVGTFDEAFKSRILLSLHYDKLSKGQRRKIWRGFMDHLKHTHFPSSVKGGGREHNGGSSATNTASLRRLSQDGLPDIDFQEIRDYLDELASHELNGRQIRNIITTARQLAKFRKKTLDYGLLQEVISESGKFDEYFSKLNENQSDEQIARSDGIR